MKCCFFVWSCCRFGSCEFRICELSNFSLNQNYWAILYIALQDFHFYLPLWPVASIFIGGRGWGTVWAVSAKVSYFNNKPHGLPERFTVILAIIQNMNNLRPSNSRKKKKTTTKKLCLYVNCNLLTGKLFTRQIADADKNHPLSFQPCHEQKMPEKRCQKKRRKKKETWELEWEVHKTLTNLPLSDYEK